MITLDLTFQELLLYAINWIEQSEPKILEINCGKGDFAKLARKRKIKNFMGMDARVNLIKQAKSRNLGYRFMVGDITKNFHYFKKMTTVILLNQLQKYKRDEKILNNIKEETTVIFSVTNYQKKDEYRKFEARDWFKRYEKYIDFDEVITANNPQNPNNRTFLFKGVRNHYIEEDNLAKFPHIKLETAAITRTYVDDD